MKILNNKISSVTIFTNLAQITRTAEIELEEGEHSLVFDDLPLKIDEKSIQVNGTGSAILTNVKYQIEYTNNMDKIDFKTLEEEKIKLEDEIFLIEQKNSLLSKEKNLIENIATKITTPQKDGENTELNPEKWLKMVDFYTEKIKQIESNIWENHQILRPLQKKLQQINFQFSQKNKNIQTIKKQVLVTVQVKKQSTILLKLSYTISGAGWKPIYDLRVDTQTKKMNITYNAIITQNTSENWENIPLKLSTAKPNINGVQPELNPWRIDIQRNYGGYGVSEALRSASPKSDLAMNMMQQFKPESEEDDDLEAASFDEVGEEAIEYFASVVDTKTTSVFFEIGGLHTIKSDNTDHKVTIYINDFSAHFRYSCVPKLSNYVYLKAKVVNNSEYPFLEGESNIFLDNNFIATARIQTVAPTEEFWTFLGIDEGMKVEHKFLKKYETKESGFFSKKTTTWLYEYSIKIKSYKKTTEELVVWDQLPISGNSTIKITLLEPHFKENTDKLKKNEYNYLEWFFDIESNQEIIIPFKFSVEYPNDKTLLGI